MIEATVKETAPFGEWPSPITPEIVVEGARTVGEIHVDGDDVYWLEGRPDEDGRNVVVRRRTSGTIEEVTPAGTNARTRVHEYGGGAYTVAGGVVWYAEFTDQRVYRVEQGGAPVAVTPEPAAPASVRYADFDVAPTGRHLVCVRETHDGESAEEVRNEIVAIPADRVGEPVVIASGRDFYASPRISPDGRRVAYVAWDHPNMPWDDTCLVVADVGPDLAVTGETVVAGEGGGESVILPAWGPDGALHFVSDRTGWWNLYRRDGEVAVNLAPVEAELGGPQWVLGGATYAFLPDGRIAVAVTRDAVTTLAILDPQEGTLEETGGPDTEVWSVRTHGESIVHGGWSSTDPDTIWRVETATGRRQQVFRPRELPVDAAWLSPPLPITFPTSEGDVAHAFFYPPHSPTHRGPDGELPPLIVTSHGGPTSHAAPKPNLGIHYWTSRGFGVVDVNYRGSTGFGRDYRRALYGTWGVYDVDDCVAAAQFLAGRAEADPDRLVVRGGSASGYTTLCALTFHDVFAAGASYFGVADLALLAEETHKFESRYLDQLVGPYPEAREVYEERSPIRHTERLSAPIILFQGLEDRVVPPSQAEVMVEALARKGVTHEYVTFPDEQHGFRRAENQRRCLEDELAFYLRVLGTRANGSPGPAAD